MRAFRSKRGRPFWGEVGTLRSSYFFATWQFNAPHQLAAITLHETRTIQHALVRLVRVSKLVKLSALVPLAILLDNARNSSHYGGKMLKRLLTVLVVILILPYVLGVLLVLDTMSLIGSDGLSIWHIIHLVTNPVSVILITVGALIVYWIMTGDVFEVNDSAKTLLIYIGIISINLSSIYMALVTGTPSY